MRASVTGPAMMASEDLNVSGSPQAVGALSTLVEGIGGITITWKTHLDECREMGS